MNWSETVERTIPAVIAVGLTFAFNVWNQNRLDEAARLQSIATQPWVKEQLAPTRDLASRNQRTNVRQDRLWARMCERQQMSCDLRDAVLRWPGNPPIPAPDHGTLPVVHDKRERESSGAL